MRFIYKFFLVLIIYSAETTSVFAQIGQIGADFPAITNRHLAVFIIDFPDAPKSIKDNYYPTIAALKDTIFNGSIKKYLTDMSYGQFTLTGDAFGYFTHQNPGFVNGIAMEFEDVMRISTITIPGFDINKYDGVLFVSINDAGLAGGRVQQRTFLINGNTVTNSVIFVPIHIGIFNRDKVNYPNIINTLNQLMDYNIPINTDSGIEGTSTIIYSRFNRTFSHEFGHFLGVGHATSRTNGTSYDYEPEVANNDCKCYPSGSTLGSLLSLDYGNKFDVMGLSEYGMSLNMAFRDLFGWTNSTNRYSIKNYGHFTTTISPLNNLNGIRAVEIRVPFKHSSNSIFKNKGYFLEVRTGNDKWDKMLLHPQLQGNNDGIMVMKTDGYSSELLDMSPSPNISYYGQIVSDIRDVVLKPGMVYDNSEIRLSNIIKNADGSFTIDIDVYDPLFVITAGGPTTFCGGGSVLLSSSYGSGNQWYKNGVIITGATSPTYTANASGVYTDTVTNAGGVKVGSSGITIKVNPLPPVPSISAGTATTLCSGGSVTLTSNATSGNQWSKDGVAISTATGKTFTATESGIYTVFVSNNVCSSPPSAGTQVIFNPKPAAIITPIGAVSFCSGKSVMLKANLVAGYKYQWKKSGVNIAGAISSTYTATTSGIYAVAVSNTSGCTAVSPGITVSVNTFPLAMVTAAGSLTFCSGKNVVLKANTGAGYTHQWKKSGANIANATLASYTATVSGVYTVVVTNAAGCSTTSTGTTVLVNAVPIATMTAGGPLTFCTGKNVLLRAYQGTGYTYQWKKSGVNITGAIQANYTATLSGVYTVVVTNAAGCSITSAGTTVLVNAVPIATITAGGPLTFCAGKNVLLRAYPGTGYTYQWKKSGVNIAGAIQTNYTATVSGVYTVVVTNVVGCPITSAGTTVVVNPVPIATIAAAGPLIFCAGKNVVLKAITGAGYTYQWKKSGIIIAGADLPVYTATTTGIYNVVITNVAGCSTTSTAITVVVNPVPIATITAGGPLTFCAGKNVLLKANPGTGYTYQWKKSGLIITGAIQANYTATASGLYTVGVTNAVGCSITSAGTTVLVNPVPIATITAGGPLTFCTGKNVLLRAYPGTGYTYQWKKTGVNIAGATQANYTATVSGVYTVVVTNAVGCSINSAGTTVVVNPVPIATLVTAGPLIFCAGQNVLLKAITGAGYTYQWKKSGIIIAGADLSTYTATTTGIYNVVITNVAGCSTTSATINVTVNAAPLATITPGGPLTFTVGGNVILKATTGTGYTYQWKKDGANLIGATADSYSVTISGSYIVVITNSNSCQATSQPVQVSVTQGRLITKGQTDGKESINLYPNPLSRNEYLYIEWNLRNADKGIQVTISDITGRKIDSRFLKPFDKKLSIKGASGIYIVEIRWGENERKIFRILKIE